MCEGPEETGKNQKTKRPGYTVLEVETDLGTPWGSRAHFPHKIQGLLVCVCPWEATALGNGFPGWPGQSQRRERLSGLVGIQAGFPGEALFKFEPER